MNIIYMLQDNQQPGGYTTAVAQISDLFYDSDIQGLVITCAGGRHLVKRMSASYYDKFLGTFLQQSANPDIVYNSITSMGPFMRVPIGDNYAVFTHGHGQEFRKTIIADDTGIPESERDNRRVSKMQLG